MKAILMHKRIPVAEVELGGRRCEIVRIGQIFEIEHLPVGIPVRGGRPDRSSLNSWWSDRSIPMARTGIADALETLGVDSPAALLLPSLGLSLSDHYWICPAGSGLSWDDVNWFKNDFAEDVGDVLMGDRKSGSFSLSSPDSTSDGNLRKRWKIISGKRCLIKGGSSPFRQQPYNEVIASSFMDRLGIPNVSYSVILDKGAPYSVCEDFVTPDTELIPAWRIIQTRRKANNVSLYSHFVGCARDLGIPDVVSFLDRMITIDYLIANEDRHFNNFGALRDPETLKWIGMAPIYDSGSSLGYDKVAKEILSGTEVACKPFKKSHSEQMKLVSDLSWVRTDELNGLWKEAEQVLDSAGDLIDPERAKAIVQSVGKRTARLKELCADREISDDLSQDLRSDVAAKYREGPRDTRPER